VDEDSVKRWGKGQFERVEGGKYDGVCEGKRGEFERVEGGQYDSV